MKPSIPTERLREPNGRLKSSRDNRARLRELAKRALDPNEEWQVLKESDAQAILELLDEIDRLREQLS
jgi:hypothetical protein